MSSARCARSVFSSKPSSICIVGAGSGLVGEPQQGVKFLGRHPLEFQGHADEAPHLGERLRGDAGAAHRVRSLVGNSPHQDAVTLGERKGQLPLLDRLFEFGAHCGGARLRGRGGDSAASGLGGRRRLIRGSRLRGRRCGLRRRHDLTRRHRLGTRHGLGRRSDDRARSVRIGSLSARDGRYRGLLLPRQQGDLALVQRPLLFADLIVFRVTHSLGRRLVAQDFGTQEHEQVALLPGARSRFEQVAEQGIAPSTGTRSSLSVTVSCIRPPSTMMPPSSIRMVVLIERLLVEMSAESASFAPGEESSCSILSWIGVALADVRGHLEDRADLFALNGLERARRAVDARRWSSCIDRSPAESPGSP